MSSKAKKRGKRLAVSDLFREAQRLFARRQFKEALKQARLCYRQQPAEEHRRLLEQVSLARAEELARVGLEPQARTVIEEFLALGPPGPEARRELPPLLIRLGLREKYKDLVAQELTPEAHAALVVSAADEAVLRPATAPATFPEVGAGVQSVHDALQALERGDEAAAVAVLKAIPRQSPFADWKLFVRGLAAYARHDDQEMRANWDRLDPRRRAARIAAPLRALADPEGFSDRQSLDDAIRPLDYAVFGGPVIPELWNMQREAASGDWRGALAPLRRLQGGLRRTAPLLWERLLRLVLGQILRAGDEAPLKELTRSVDPLPFDPHWNRAWALLWEHPDQAEFERCERRWMAYLNDLAEVPLFSDEERRLAQALVWQRIGNMYVEEVDAALDVQAGQPRLSEEDEFVRQDQKQVLDCFEHSFRLYPKLREAYQDLAEAQVRWGEEQQAVRTRERLLEQFPDDLETLLFLGQQFVERDDMLRAKEYILRAQRLKPLDEDIRHRAWAVHLGSARHYAKQRDWDAGRAAFTEAERLDPAGKRRMWLLVRQAAFEFKAGDARRGRQLIEEARQAADAPGPMWLGLSIESVRYGLSKKLKDEFNANWRDELKKRCNSPTAGQCCEILLPYLAADVKYTGRPQHVTELVNYVSRASRVKFQPGDLRHVCLFAETINRPDLLERYVRKGLKYFSEIAYFHYMAGELEFHKGPYRCDRRRASAAYERALDIAERSDDRDERWLIEPIKRRLTLLRESGLNPFDFDFDFDFGGMPFPPPGGGRRGRGPRPEELFKELRGMIENLGYDPDEVFGDFSDDEEP